MTDQEIIAEVLRGDVRAERQLYDAHVDRIYRLAYRMAGDETLARDFTEIRRNAISWLGQSKDPRAVEYFEEILTRGR